MSNSLQPHGLQPTRLLYSSLSPRVCSNSCPSRHWCYVTILTSGAHFSSCLQSSCLQSFSALESSPMSWLFISGSQNTEASISASVLPMISQSWFPSGLTGFISLQSKGLSRVISSTTIQKHQFFCAQPSLWSNSYIYTWHDYWKNRSFD